MCIYIYIFKNFFSFWREFFFGGGGAFQLSFGEIFAAVVESGLDARGFSSSPTCLLNDLSLSCLLKECLEILFLGTVSTAGI